MARTLGVGAEIQNTMFITSNSKVYQKVIHHNQQSLFQEDNSGLTKKSMYPIRHIDSINT